jgi:23S rRNA (pseudouridine1915-N3)-methyltransferase
VRLTVVAVGKLKERYYREAANEYLKRLAPYARLDEVEVADRDLSRGEKRGRAEEGVDVLKAIPDGAHVVLLDIQGRERSSEQIAAWLDEHALQGRSSLAFVIGGAAGVAPEVAARANERLSLGRITLPHQLARVVLLEQLYRAFRISRGEPYHR